MDKKYCEQLAKIMICPKTKEPLVYDENLAAFVNKEHKVIYRIEDGIPVMLDEEAKVIEEAALKKHKAAE